MGFDGTAITFAPDLMQNLTYADRASRQLMKAVDAYIEAEGLNVPEADRHNTDDGDPEDKPIPALIERLSLANAHVRTIVWATGFACDYTWVRLPVLDDRGYPLQDCGVTPFDGLYFCGLHWMHSLKSGLLFGVGEAAEHVVRHLLQRAARPHSGTTQPCGRFWLSDLSYFRPSRHRILPRLLAFCVDLARPEFAARIIAAAPSLASFGFKGP